MTENMTTQIYAARWSKHSEGISLIGRLVIDIHRRSETQGLEKKIDKIKLCSSESTAEKGLNKD